MKTIILTISILFSTSVVFAQVEDIDGNQYKTTQVGQQTWLEDNLNTSRFANGDSIFYARNMSDWKKAIADKIPAFCDYEFNPENSEEFGKLYNHYAVTDPRGLAPEGFKVPSKKDFKQLISYVGDGNQKGDRVGDRLKSCSGWTESNMDNGSNTSGMSLKPNGRVNALPHFWNGGQSVHLWMSDKFGPFQGYVFCVYHSCMGAHTVIEHFQKRHEGMAVRCIKS